MADDATLRDLQARLQRLEDLEEIRRLYLDYGMNLDAGDAAAYAQLFARNAKLRLGPVMKGDSREEIAEAAAKAVKVNPDGSRTSVHVLNAPRIELNGDTATGECVWLAVSVSTGTQKTIVGRHVDELVKEDGRWRFAKRKGLLDIGGL